MSFDDATRAPRKGEEVEAGRLGEYLKQEGLFSGGTIEISQFPSGHSNLTYLVRAGGEEMVLRRPPGGKKPKSGHDMHREWVMLSALKGAFPYIPEPLSYCEDPEIIGAPFFLMRRIHGLILRRDPAPELGLSPPRMKKLCERLVEVQRELHALDYRELGLEDLAHPDGYVGRQISGWSRRYRDARTPDVSDFEEIMAWLDAHRPPERGASIIHNDYRFDNVVLDPEDLMQIVGILDWEMATIGDPLMDLGASLAYWVEAGDSPGLQSIRLGPTNAPGALSRRELVESYLETAGIEVEDFGFYYVYGLFRLAGIAQQIYYRYYHGQTRDERFGRLGRAVMVLEEAAQKAMIGA